MTILFDTVDISTDPYVPRFIKHETVPERILSLMELARENGSVIVAEKYGVKHILLQGIIYGSTQVDLETKIDTFKELFSREAKDLDISWEAGTRRYVATCVSHKFDRDYFHISICPWTADFIVPEGVGKDTTRTDAVITIQGASLKDQEWSDANFNSHAMFGGVSYKGQSFTTGVGITDISIFKAYLKYEAGAKDTIYCDIYLADVNHKPTGVSLGQASISSITNTNDEWKSFNFLTPISLDAETEYVAVISSPDSSQDVYRWGFDVTGSYADGMFLTSGDGGSNWNTESNYDLIFETWYVTSIFPYTGSVTFAGSAEPKPIILLSITSGWTNARGVSFENTTTGEKLVINTGETSINNGDKFEIDCANKTVRWYHGGWINMGFRGVFPHFIIGVNEYRIEAGDIIDQQYTEGIYPVAIAIYTGQTNYQSFTVPQSQRDYQGITLKLSKLGTPPNDLIITILNDLDGAPDATSPVVNATFTVVSGDATGTLAWIFKNSTNKFYLDADKTYWIRAAMAAGDDSNCFYWETDQYGNYPRGNVYGNPGWDFLFKLYYAGKIDSSPVQTLDIDYYKRYL